jgi:hypothetical protein
MKSETGVPAIAGSKGDLRVFQRTLEGQPCYRDGRGNRFVLDGRTLDTPAASEDSAGKLHLAVRGTDNAVYVRTGTRA